MRSQLKEYTNSIFFKCSLVTEDSGLTVYKSFGLTAYKSFGLTAYKSFGLTFYKSFGLTTYKSFGLTFYKSFGLTAYKSFGLTVYKSFGLTVYKSFGLTALIFTFPSCKKWIFVQWIPDTIRYQEAKISYFFYQCPISIFSLREHIKAVYIQYVANVGKTICTYCSTLSGWKLFV